MHISIQMTCHVDIISKTFYMVNKILEMLYIVAAFLYMGLTVTAIATTNEKETWQYMSVTDSNLHVCSNTLQQQLIILGAQAKSSSLSQRLAALHPLCRQLASLYSFFFFFGPRLKIMTKTSQSPTDPILERKLVSLVRIKICKYIDLPWGINTWSKLSISSCY